MTAVAHPATHVAGEPDTAAGLLARLRAFCLPGGEDNARRVGSVKTTQSGEIRSAPGAPWVPFTADEVTSGTESSFRWEARFKGGRMGWFVVTDAYEDGQGFGSISLGGVLPVRKMTGPEFDKGELQRYLASVALCPAMMVNHSSLAWTAVGPQTLRVCDRNGAAGATVDVELNERGYPIVCHAERPRMVGRITVPAPWSAVGADFEEREGLRVATRLEATWHLPEGSFTYFRARVNSFEIRAARN
ncbi:MAG TPA: DUF6544 family protein [Terriglobia bacterium]|nr:DUF6544 family protein [Terriglobia bacterium]